MGITCSPTSLGKVFWYIQFRFAAFKDIRLQKRFFVELGAHNGEFNPIQIFFEFFKNWKGSLIEPNPKCFEKLLKDRNALGYNFAVVGNDFRKDHVHLIDLGEIVSHT